MKRLKRWCCVLVAVLATAGLARAFSMLGPNPQWQLDDYAGFTLTYDLPGDIGGPMTFDEGYRWNVPVITYAFDRKFVLYFGTNGMKAVREAVKILNDLPPMSAITHDGSSLYIRGEQVPTDTKRKNFQAEALGLLDVKSTALSVLLEEMGLAAPERWVWTLRGRNTVGNPPITNYTVVRMNFDPITITPSSFVNGILYTYDIVETRNPNRADAQERPIDPLATFAFSSVAGFNLFEGEFYTGLTHDDVGGLRYLYGTNAQRWVVESLLTNTIPGTPQGGGSPWTPYFNNTNVFAQGTNFVFSTNVLQVQGLRPGINKITFQEVFFDSIIGSAFATITNRFTDTILSNNVAVIQPVQRVISAPDIVFTVEDLGVVNGLVPALLARTGTAGWQNNDAVNGIDVQVDGGPGVIQPSVVIRFSEFLPYWGNSTGSFFIGTGGLGGIGGGGLFGFGDEATAFRSFIWGSFDGTTNAPIIFPEPLQLTVQQLQEFVLRGGN